MALLMVQKKLNHQKQLNKKDQYPAIYKLCSTTFDGFDYD